VRTISVAERRARLGRRHHLAASARAADAETATRDLVALHATDPATVYLSVAVRLPSPAIEPTERALYHHKTLLRMLGMRRTMFVVPVEHVPIVQAAATDDIARTQRRLTMQILAQAGIADDDGRWLRRVEAATMEALEARGSATASELGKDVPELRLQMAYGEGKKWAGAISVSFRVLTLLSAEGRIVRGRPGGTWTGSQYRWAPMSTWLPGGIETLPKHDAQAHLARRWLERFGPATAADLKWWTGWTVADTKRAINAVQAVEVDLDGATGFVLADDVDPEPETEPWVALVPALDPTVMGWTERDWYLGQHRAALFDRNGNGGPTIWSDGRVVGGWAQRKDGEIAVRLLEDVGAEVEAQVADAAEGLRQLYGDVRAIPRFRTPLERDLTS